MLGAGVAKQIHDEIVSLHQRLWGESRERDRGDSHEPLKIDSQHRHQSRDLVGGHRTYGVRHLCLTVVAG
jgi:hypothetical protein